MEKAEWVRRYQAEFKRAANLTDAQAQDCSVATSFEEASRDFEDDPEGAAQMEMSYWSD